MQLIQVSSHNRLNDLNRKLIFSLHLPQLFSHFNSQQYQAILCGNVNRDYHPSDHWYRSAELNSLLFILDRTRRMQRTGYRIAHVSVATWKKIMNSYRNHIHALYQLLSQDEKSCVQMLYDEMMKPETMTTSSSNQVDDIVMSSNIQQPSIRVELLSDFMIFAIDDDPSPSSTSYSPMSVNQQLAMVKYLNASETYFTLYLNTLINPQLELPPDERTALRRLIRTALSDWKAARRFASRVGLSKLIQLFFDRVGLYNALKSNIPLPQQDPKGILRSQILQTVRRDIKIIYDMMTKKEQQWMKMNYERMMDIKLNLDL